MMLIAIFITLVLGVLLAALGVLPLSLMKNLSDFPFYCLCFLLFIVGYGMGKDKEAFRALAKGNIRLMIIPLGTVIGAFAAGLAASLFLSLGLRECLAISCGFGWYSYSAVYLTEMHSASLGATAFLANVFREILTFFMIPVMVKIFGAYPAVSIGGATTMDVTLPVISRYAGQEAAIAAFLHGVVISALTPVILPLII